MREGESILKYQKEALGRQLTPIQEQLKDQRAFLAKAEEEGDEEKISGLKVNIEEIEKQEEEIINQLKQLKVDTHF